MRILLTAILQDGAQKKWTLSKGSRITLSEQDLGDFEKIFAAVSAFKGVHPDLVEEVAVKDHGREQSALARQNSGEVMTEEDDFELMDQHLRQAIPVFLRTYRMLRAIQRRVEAKDVVEDKS